jgi:hypothetical protein
MGQSDKKHQGILTGLFFAGPFGLFIAKRALFFPEMETFLAQNRHYTAQPVPAKNT